MAHSGRFALASGIATAGMICAGGCATERADWLVRRDANHLNAIAQAERHARFELSNLGDNWAGSPDERATYYNPYEFGREQQ
jgi:hypothetical protein